MQDELGGFPALIAVMTAGLALGWAILLPVEFQSLGKHTAAGSGFFSNILLWSEAGYFDAEVQRKPLLHLWSLGVEEQFYFVWPLFVWAAWQWRRRIVGLLCCVTLISFALNIFYVQTGDSLAAFYSPLARLWEFSAGAILSSSMGDGKLSLSRAIPVSVRNLCSLLGVMLICSAAWLMNQTMPFPGWWAAVPVAGAMLLIGPGHRGAASRVISHPAIV